MRAPTRAAASGDAQYRIPSTGASLWSGRGEPEAPQDLPAPSAAGAGPLTDADAERWARLRLVDPKYYRDMLQYFITDAVEYVLEEMKTWPLPRLPPPNFPAPPLPTVDP